MAAGAQQVRAASAREVRDKGCKVVALNGHTVALFPDGDAIRAIDNRCPHMGFPLHRGSLKDGILTCHWHHARFDLATGGTFDLWADDVRAFPVEIRGDEVWVDLTPPADALRHLERRLHVGLERAYPLVISKSVLAMLDSDVDPVEPFRAGLLFGARHRRAGWGMGLTIHGCMANLAPHLDAEDRPRALCHGLAAVARECDGEPIRFLVDPLPGAPSDIPTLKRWLRQFIEVRDAEGAERCVVSAIRAGADSAAMAGMLFAAATDHRYIDVGHPLDFTNKAFEALDIAGWEHAEPVLTSLVRGYANADRMEESNAWRHPVDIIAILERAFEEIPATSVKAEPKSGWDARQRVIPTVTGGKPQAIAETLLHELKGGASPVQLAEGVARAAAMRIAQFATSNEHGDWDTALHTFTFANAVQQGLRRAPSVELLRGVFDAAMSVHLDRFLNVPPAKLPVSVAGEEFVKPAAKASLEDFPTLLDRQQQVEEAGTLTADCLAQGEEPNHVIAMLGKMLLREDRDFHTIQCVEAAVRQHNAMRGTPQGAIMLVAAARYLAAHAPTVRSQRQTYDIARRLTRGENLHGDENGE
jgi:nitrite reductase/ring-hydroxylating ferredoxin subunit